jgi:hypothetical protein
MIAILSLLPSRVANGALASMDGHGRLPPPDEIKAAAAAAAAKLPPPSPERLERVALILAAASSSRPMVPRQPAALPGEPNADDTHQRRHLGNTHNQVATTPHCCASS